MAPLCGSGAPEAVEEKEEKEDSVGGASLLGQDGDALAV